MVEVFRTNVRTATEARKLVRMLQRYYPGGHINFDLEDCDNILRVKHEAVNASHVIPIMKNHGYICEVLPD
jgi:hypothetical protein